MNFMKISFLCKLVVTLLLTYIITPVVHADFFKWEVLVSEQGYGTESKNFPIVSEGKIDKLDENFKCSLKNFWTKIESELLLEGKTLECVYDGKKRIVSLICRDNHKKQKIQQDQRTISFRKRRFSLLYLN